MDYQDLKEEIRKLPDKDRDAFIVKKVDESVEETYTNGTGYFTHFVNTSKLLQALKEVRSEAFSSIEQLNEFMGQ